MEADLSDYLKPGKQRCGLTGLKNLGNTCFMSSVLQCLANTEPLVKYFLYGVYQSHINSKNAYGTRGKLALAYAELLVELYAGTASSVAPWDVKRVVAYKARQFDGFAQHDSQEMLSVLLETLHEDVNSVSKKPYVEYKDAEKRSDHDISKEYWQGFLKREKSIFVELFYGQLKSRVQCTQCGYISLSFDPFNVLSLPVPTAKNQNFTIRYIPIKVDEPPKEFHLTVGEFVTVNELKNKLEDFLKPRPEDDPEDEWIEPFLTSVTNKQGIDLITEERFVKTQGNDKTGAEIIAYEREPLSLFDLKKTDDCSDFHICELRMVQRRNTYMGLSSENKQIGYSRLHLFRKEWTVRRLRLKIYEIVRPLIKKALPSLGIKAGMDLQTEYNTLFKDSKGKYNINNELFDLEIHNNLPQDSGYFSKVHSCDFCGQAHRDNCVLAYEDDVTLENILSHMKYERELELTINWKSSAKVSFKAYDNPSFAKVNLNAPAGGANSSWVAGSSKNISIYDCLTYFSQEETLAGSDKWYCCKCKAHVAAFKKMEIYKTPEFLVVHFKRFSH
jgi:hypothetical protein